MLLDQLDAKANSSVLVWLPADGGAPVVIANDINAHGYGGHNRDTFGHGHN